MTGARRLGGLRALQETVSSSAVALERNDVDRLRSLVTGLGVEGHLGALLQRAISLANDPGVMDEEILVAVVGGDETEPLVVAEPLNGARRHCVPPLCRCLLRRGGRLKSFDLRALALL